MIEDIVLGILSSVLANELSPWLVKFSRVILKLSIKILPYETKERYSEEWAAHLDETPGVLCKLLTSLGFLQGASLITCKYKLDKLSEYSEAQNIIVLWRNLKREALISLVQKEFIALPSIYQDKVNILSISLNNLSQSELLLKLTEGVLFTPDVDHLMRLERDWEFLEVYKHADYVVCSSQFLYYASRFLGTPIKEQISSADLFYTFLWFHRDNSGIKIYLLGGAMGSAPKAHQSINHSMGRDMIIGSCTPSFGFEKNEEECLSIIEEINHLRPTVVVVGVGTPKQEKWIAKYKDMMPSVKIFLAVGAAIDFASGNISRAPQWVSQAGLEWLYRVSCEPQRLRRRYFVDDLPIVWHVLRQKFGRYNPPFS